MPAIVAITLSFLTRQVLISLFSGIVTGSVVLAIQTKNISNLNVINIFFTPALGSESYALILLIYLWCLGGILGLWGKTGGAMHFGKILSSKLVKGRKSALFLSWVMGIIFHQGGTVGAIMTSTTVKPISDKYKISHEELSYIVDSTASPIATLIPFNAWPAYISGLIVGTVPIISNMSEANNYFLSSIPFNFYAIIAVLFSLLFSLGLIPVKFISKKMHDARKRALETGKLDSETSIPLLVLKNNNKIPKNYDPSLYDFFVPIIILLFVTITPFLLWQINIIEEEKSNWIKEAFMLSAISSMIVAKIRGMKSKDIIDGFIEGCQNMTIGAIVLGLAITLGLVAWKLQTAEYLIYLISDTIPTFLLPAILTILCMIVAFSTGTAFGTYAVIFPIAIPLAFAINPDPFYIKICFGAVLGGTVFGDQCSPISDTTIVSSMFTGCDLMDHVKTQFPFAFIASILSMLLSTLMIFIYG